MKPAQWMAVLLLALMVGGITFVMVYLGSSRGSIDTPPPKSAGLTFTQKKYPGDGDKALTTEVNHLGYRDFWFVNDSGQSVPVGLNGKSCTCTQVEFSIAPESWKSSWPEASAGQVLRQASLLLPSCAWNGLQDLAANAPELSESEVKTTALGKENSVVVPPDAFGWVRLSWQKPDARSLTISADLWMSQKEGTTSARLEVAGILITRPMEVNTDMAVGAFNVRDLEKGQKLWFLCWSATRPSFTVKAQLVHERDKAESDPIEVGQPVPLTAEDLRHIELSEKMPLQVLSGYRVPVTLRAKAKDGTLIELGHFRRYVNLSSGDEGIEPVQVKVTGTVHGDVTVGFKEGGAINLGPFTRSRGARGDIILQTDVKGLDLELDAARVPEYLKVRFPKEPEVLPSGHREWVLEVEVPPNAARGEFPRADDPAYRDSAIYVKTKGENPPRSIRVPVTGAANEG